IRFSQHHFDFHKERLLSQVSEGRRGAETFLRHFRSSVMYSAQGAMGTRSRSWLPAEAARVSKRSCNRRRTHRPCLETNWSGTVNSWLDFVVPIAMELVAPDLNLCQLLIGDR